ncbi:ABC transporter substrate-binding protein [Nostoc sphaeroides CHAB 2801]|uniref:ABC transporter substrate-binding protein n=1 Tax=Nostoc sphaeroides TaxID=446679 RepID=UPI001E63969A|nr:ABC transporter substrate-binding protein [Nostoc sphaeroides]MCC5632416.1 ABC transporter substrate-binding protein [Nostoc sphaeroides CHAB 2801]
MRNSLQLTLICRAKKLKQWILGVMTVICAIALTNCMTPTPTPSLLRIGTNLWTGYETLYLARHLGYYEGTPIRLIDFPSGTEEVRAYRNHEIEGAGLSIDQAMLLAATQKNLRIIAIMDVSHGGDVILGKPNIANIKALKGKRVGVESTALGAFFIARALEKNGLSPKDIQIVSLDFSQHERAFKDDKVDAIVTFGPPRVKLLAAGAKLLFDSSQIPGEIVDTLVVSEEAIATNSPAIQTLVNERFRALDYLNKNPQKAAEMIAPRTGVTSKQILDAFKGMHQPNLQENQRLLDQTDPSLAKGMQRLVEVMVEHKLMPKAIDSTAVLDDRFVKTAKL